MKANKLSNFQSAPPLNPGDCDLIVSLKKSVGGDQVLTSPDHTRSYLIGYRVGEGNALAVVRPLTLLAMWRAAQVCVEHGAIIIVQAANTGLTGGSTPFGTYDRSVVLISTEMLRTIVPVREGREAICFPGSTLTQLEDAIRPYGRTPHSVIGSSCIGASVVGGICNNSGGALVRRGPAFTQHALFARITTEGELQIVNHLGCDLGVEAEEMLHRLENGEWHLEPDIMDAEVPKFEEYSDVVRRAEATPARFNADPRYLHEAAGCAGKLIVFAVRVPTFASSLDERSFAIGTQDPNAFAVLRREILDRLDTLPAVCEYMNRNAVDIATSHGRDICALLRVFGPAAMPRLSALQKRLDRWAVKLRLGGNLSGKLAHWGFKLAPQPLRRSLRRFVASYDHILLITTDGDAIEPLEHLLSSIAKERAIKVRELTVDEAAAAFRLRFAAAGAMTRFRDLQKGTQQLSAIDVALARDTSEWLLDLPVDLRRQVVASAVYGHFLCHVFHLDYLLRQGVPREDFETMVKAFVESRGGQMPAEHNFGHLYEAPPHVAAFYRELDPTNTLNPGIGKTSRNRNWA